MDERDKNKSVIRKRKDSFKYAFYGIAYTVRTQINFRIQIVAGILVIILGFIFQISLTEWYFIAMAIGIVFITELINTSIEFIIDIISPQYNDKAGRAKDIAAGAVVVAAITAAIIGMLIFIPKLIK